MLYPRRQHDDGGAVQPVWGCLRDFEAIPETGFLNHGTNDFRRMAASADDLSHFMTTFPRQRARWEKHRIAASGPSTRRGHFPVKLNRAIRSQLCNGGMGRDPGPRSRQSLRLSFT